MNLFDASRPKNDGGHAQLLHSVDAVPVLYLDPTTSTDVEVSAWVRVEDGSGFVCRSKQLCLADLGSFMAEFIADPEAVLRRDFAWTAVLTRVAKRQVTSAARDTSRDSSGVVDDIDVDEL